MQARTLAGPEAASQKYDILTALGAHALANGAASQRLVLRFITLVTARYNWRLGSLTVGQREIARLWSVDERTVKREMARLRSLGWLVLESPARRGRVASYSLDLIAVRAATRPDWSRVGIDFEARMAGSGPSPHGTVVPFPRAEGTNLPPAPAAETEDESGEDGTAGAGAWDSLRRALQAEDPVLFATWFEALRDKGISEGCLVLLAPTAFHASYIKTHYAERLLRAARRTGGPSDIRLLARDQ